MRTSPGGIGGSDCARREGNKHISATRRSSTRAAVEFADGVVIRVQRGEVEGIIAKLQELVTAQPVLSMIDHGAKDSQTGGFGTAVTITDYIRYAQAYSPTVARAVPFTALAVAGTKPDPVTVPQLVLCRRESRTETIQLMTSKNGTDISNVRVGGHAVPIMKARFRFDLLHDI